MSPILFIAIFIFSGLIFYKLNSLIYKRKSKIIFLGIFIMVLLLVLNLFFYPSVR